jgi:small-conductance mechanosensitive channel
MLVGADQVGLKVTWVAILAAVIVASVMGGVAIAVSLGARAYVANLLGAFYLRQALQPGQRVRVAGHEGRIVDVTATSLVLETADGRVLLPGSCYHDDAIVVFAREEGA